MRTLILVTALVGTTLTAGTAAEAKGCIRGAIAGGVAGHYAGHHAIMGAAAGCALTHHYYKNKMAQQKAQAQAAAAQRQHP